MYRRLQVFHMAKGHIQVTPAEAPALSYWILRQLAHIRRGDKHNPLSNEQQDKLISLGILSSSLRTDMVMSAESSSEDDSVCSEEDEESDVKRHHVENDSKMAILIRAASLHHPQLATTASLKNPPTSSSEWGSTKRKRTVSLTSPLAKISKRAKAAPSQGSAKAIPMAEHGILCSTAAGLSGASLGQGGEGANANTGTLSALGRSVADLVRWVKGERRASDTIPGS